MIIDITTMQGEIPRLPPHLAADNTATLAKNCHFPQGAIAPCLADSATDKHFAFPPATLWRYRDDFWFAFREQADIIKSPVAQDAYGRVYWSDGKFPKYTTAETATKGSDNYPAYSYRLGIQAPAARIVCRVTDPVHYSDEIIPPELPEKPADESLTEEYNAAVAAINARPAVYKPATPDPSDTVTRYYTETFVSDLGEEGPPGKPSDEVTLLWPDSTVTLTLQPAGNQNSRINRRRIYRSASGGGIASYLLVAELPVSQQSFTDNIPDSQLTAPLETWHYLPPPENLQGLCLMANGIAAGFSGNTLYFSAAYLPYAWPPDYQRTTSADITGIAPAGTSLVVTTRAEPWLFSGVSPSAITGVRLPVIAPCASRNSIVAMGNMVIYASPRGLVAVSAAGEAQLVSENLLTAEQWQHYQPDNISAWHWRGEYYAAHSNGVLVFSPQTGSIRHLDTRPGAVYSDSERDSYYYTTGSQLHQAHQGEAHTWHWRSKIWLTAAHTTFSCLRIRSSRPAAIGIRIWSDNQLIIHLPRGSLTSGTCRLPAISGSQWQAEAYGNAPLERITLSSTAQEMPA